MDSFDELKLHASNKDPVSQFKLGYQYLRGKNGQVDNEAAAYWFRQAADLGDSNAWLMLGNMTLDGKLGEPSDSIEAHKFWLKSLEHDDKNGHALCNLGLFYHLILLDFEEAIKYYEKAARENFSFAQWAIGLMHKYHMPSHEDDWYVTELFVKAGSIRKKEIIGEDFKFYSSAELLFKEAADISIYDADGEETFLLSQLYSNDQYPFYDKQKSEFLLDIAINKGSSSACDKKASRLIFSDEKLSYQLSKKAALKNNVHGINKIARAYRYGKGVKKNIYKSIQWYRKAAKLGSSFANNVLGKAYLNGDGVSINVAKGLRCLEVAAKINPNYQYELGKLYFDAKYFPQDLELSAIWLKKACDSFNSSQDQDSQAHYDAYCILGKIYGTKNFSGYDFKKSLTYLTISARDGFVLQNYSSEANYLLGRLYSEGIYIEKNLHKAIYFFTRCTDSGLEFIGPANEQLMLIYNLKAIQNNRNNDNWFWYKLAALNNHAELQYEYSQLLRNLKLDQQMYEQISGIFQEALQKENESKTALSDHNFLSEFSAHIDSLSDDMKAHYTESSKRVAYLSSIMEPELMWLMRSAENGYYRAQFALSRRYSDGEGLGKDLVLAYAWLKIAEEKANPKYIEEKFRILSSAMTAGEINIAKSMASSWKIGNSLSRHA